MKMALTTEELLIDAIYSHKRKDPQGRAPRRFELHPAVIAHLLSNLQEVYMVEHRPHGKRTFHGVDLVEDRMADRPKMITADNKVEYL